jgi:DNA invertase Pin-like site-specific DNA recombinase
MKDMVNKGRADRTKKAKGEDAGSAKLTEEQVIEIRKDPRTQNEIAKSYEVGQTTIGKIKRGETWKHI